MQLGLADAALHVRGFDRPNLYYAVVKAGGAADKTRASSIELVRTRDGGVALVYAATRKNAEAYAQALKKAGMRARVYHAGLENGVREKAQDVFMAGQLDVIVATNAFGMGVDKSDIRLVVHADIPRSPEAYYQEAGRGGRDGKPTRCVLLFNHGDIRLQEFLIDASYPSAELLRGMWKLLARPARARHADARRRTSSRRKLKPHLPGSPSNAAIGAALRILERHGMLGATTTRLAALRPAARCVPAARRRVAAAPRRDRAQEAPHDGRLRVQPAVPAAVRSSSTSATRTGRPRSQVRRVRQLRCGRARPHDRACRSASRTRSREACLLLIGALHGRFGRKRIARSRTAPTTMRASPSSPSAAACAAGRTSS